MFVTIHKSAKVAMLGLMFVLTGLAGMITVEVDNDGIMETPAVVIESQMDAPVEKLALVVRFESMLQRSSAERVTPRPDVAAFNEHETAAAPATVAFPLVIPLRT